MVASSVESAPTTTTPNHTLCLPPNRHPRIHHHHNPTLRKFLPLEESFARSGSSSLSPTAMARSGSNLLSSATVAVEVEVMICGRARSGSFSMAERGVYMAGYYNAAAESGATSVATETATTVEIRNMLFKFVFDYDFLSGNSNNLIINVVDTVFVVKISKNKAAVHMCSPGGGGRKEAVVHMCLSGGEGMKEAAVHICSPGGRGRKEAAVHMCSPVEEEGGGDAHLYIGWRREEGGGNAHVFTRWRRKKAAVHICSPDGGGRKEAAVPHVFTGWRKKEAAMHICLSGGGGRKEAAVNMCSPGGGGRRRRCTFVHRMEEGGRRRRCTYVHQVEEGGRRRRCTCVYRVEEDGSGGAHVFTGCTSRKPPRLSCVKWPTINLVFYPENTLVHKCKGQLHFSII